jgi:putative membrane protein
MPDLLNYLMFQGTALGILIVGMLAYVMVTPYNEFALIRSGNRCASVALGGVAIGIALPLYSIANSTYTLGVLVEWGFIALIFQLLTFFVVRLIVGDIKGKVTGDCLATGTFLALLSIAVGIINAGSVSG